MMRRMRHSGSGSPMSARRRPAHGPPSPAPDPSDPLDGLSNRARMFWLATFVAVLILLLWVLRPVFAVLAASAGIAYILDPVADWLERRRLSRDAAIGVIYISGIAGLILGVLVLLPGFLTQADNLADQVAPFFANLDQTLAPLAAKIEQLTGTPLPLDVKDLQQQAPAFIADLWPRVQDRVSTVVSGLFTQGLGLISAIVNLALLPVFVFYLLREWDRLVAAVGELIPARYRPRVGRVAAEVDQRLSAFVRGQITVCLALAGLYSLGLLIVGIDLAVPVGVLSGLLFIVPYLGTAVGIVLGVVLALMKFGLGWEILQVILVFVVVQGIEGWLLTPQIVGDKVGLHPLVVMIALIVGGSLMGIWGMLLAIPITAVLSVLANEWLSTYRASKVYTQP